MSESEVEVWTGGCLCKAVRFTVTGQPDDPHICACAHCQMRSGAPFQWWVGFPSQGLSFTGEGELTWFDTYPGKTSRGFCPVCGSPVAARDYDDETVIGIVSTALDAQEDPRLVPVNLNRLTEAASWLCETPEAQRASVG
jgi:hypothetical protein